MNKLCITQQTVSLKNKLLIVRALSQLDRFLEGEKYISIYTKYQTALLAQIKHISENVTNAIEKYDYDRVASEMIVLKLLGDVGEYFFEYNERSLNRFMNEFLEQTKTQAIMIGNNLEIDKIKFVVENLKRIQRVKQFVSQYLHTPDELDKCMKDVISMIEERLKYSLESIKALLHTNNFYEVEKKIELLNLVRNILGNYCTKQIFDEIELIKEYRNEIVLNEIVKKYSDMDIDKYILYSPIDIFEQFVQVRSINPIYNQALNNLRENIINKFRKTLELAKSVIPPNPNNIHIRKFESSVRYLPEIIRNVLEVELKHCKEDIHFLIQNTNN